jgi:hypothetical protein
MCCIFGDGPFTGNLGPSLHWKVYSVFLCNRTISSRHQLVGPAPQQKAVDHPRYSLVLVQIQLCNNLLLQVSH